MSEKKAKKWARASEGRGFTLAETLIAVALIGVMAAIAFIGVLQWRKTLKQLEFDSKAKEIYVAAQNHLTLVESQGLLESATFTNYGEPDSGASGVTASDPTGVHYFLYYNGATVPPLFEIMLPFGSIDETVRAGGSYVIRYQPDIAAVLDVFYTEDVKLTNSDYASLISLRGDDKKSDRQGFQAQSGKAIVGYYGGDSDGYAAVKLKAPSVQVQNGDVLKVVVSYPVANNDRLPRDVAKPEAELKLIVEELDFGGESTRAKRYITLENSVTNPLYKSTTGNNEIYEITLDDVTRSGVSLNATSWDDGQTDPKLTTFVPGYNLKIYAKVQSTANALKDGKPVIAIAKSNEVETNQSFAQTAKGESDVLTVEISSFRHLANLSEQVSGFTGAGNTTVVANQTTDISWRRFTKSISKEHNNGDESHAADTVIVCTDESTSKAGTFLPVNPSDDYALVYDGLKTKTEEGVTTATAHKISLVDVDTTGPAGIFGEITGRGSAIKNLVVVNAQVTTEGTGASAGALVGKLSDHATISNVLVRTSLTSTNQKYADKYADRGVTVTGTGTAGGLVGTVSNATVTDSAAAVYVKASGGTVGGLVGSAEAGSEITRSYSSAHIQTDTGLYNKGKVDVDAQGGGTAGVAGGLVGSASNTIITSCYSTCAVGNAAKVGGLAGSVALSSSDSINDCYVTGLVTNPTTTDSDNNTVFTGSVGAFIGALESGSTSKLTNDYYYKVVNGSDVKSIGGEAAEEVTSAVSPFDEMTYSNGAWSGGSALSTIFPASKDSKAVPYNQSLAKRYNGIYAFKTIDGTTSTLATPAFTDHLTRHYGDWPAYDVLFVNSGS